MAVADPGEEGRLRPAREEGRHRLAAGVGSLQPAAGAGLGKALASGRPFQEQFRFRERSLEAWAFRENGSYELHLQGHIKL